MRKKPSSRAVPNPDPYTVSTPFERNRPSTKSVSVLPGGNSTFGIA